MSRDPDREPPFADVEIGAAMRAKRLRFTRGPETEVSFKTGPDGESDSKQRRENLPGEIEPGVTYRDVGVAWVGGARIIVPSRRPDERRPRD